MCTVTIVPQPRPDGSVTGVRLACNRDELHTRPIAEAPTILKVNGTTRAIMPRDPTSRGTWIAVNDTGVILTLLNVNPAEPSEHNKRLSRGAIIPQCLNGRTTDECLGVVRNLDAGMYPPFRLVITDGVTVAEAVGNGRAIQAHVKSLPSRPMMFTSSGLGDHVVEGPRRELFDRWFDADPRRWPEQQDAFHRHHWPERSHLSVCMSRADARTVSLTVVETDKRQVKLAYWPQSPNMPSEPCALALPRRGAVA